MSLLVPDADAMEALGRNLRHPENWRGVVWLQGDLGAGKTTLVRSLLRGLGYEGRVKSPTYTLIEPYQVGDRSIYHLDLYRVSDPGELEYLGLREILAERGVEIPIIASLNGSHVGQWTEFATQLEQAGAVGQGRIVGHRRVVGEWRGAAAAPGVRLVVGSRDHIGGAEPSPALLSSRREPGGGLPADPRRGSQGAGGLDWPA